MVTSLFCIWETKLMYHFVIHCGNSLCEFYYYYYYYEFFIPPVVKVPRG